jgi:hypothetical protein
MAKAFFMARAEVPEAADRAAFDHWHVLRARLETWPLYPALCCLIRGRL